MAKALLVERFEVQGQLLEQEGAKLPQGVLCRVSYNICNIGEKNRNGRVYGKEVWDGVLANPELQEKLKNRCLFSHAEHPETTASSTEKVAAVVTDIRIDEKTNQVFATLDVLDTPYGRICDTLLRANCGLGVSTRAEGELDEVGSGEEKYYNVIPESYSFVTIDFTADPSTYGTYPKKVERDLVGIVKTGIDDGKIDRDFAESVLAHLNVPGAKKLLESIRMDKHHKNCKCKPSDKKCKTCEHKEEPVVLKEEEMIGEPIPMEGAYLVQKCKEFLQKNPNPKDEQVHEFAKSLGVETDKVEAAMYKLATKLVSETKVNEDVPKEPIPEQAVAAQIEHPLSPNIFAFMADTWSDVGRTRDQLAKEIVNKFKVPETTAYGHIEVAEEEFGPYKLQESIDTAITYIDSLTAPDEIKQKLVTWIKTPYFKWNVLQVRAGGKLEDKAERIVINKELANLTKANEAKAKENIGDIKKGEEVKVENKYVASDGTTEADVTTKDGKKEHVQVEKEADLKDMVSEKVSAAETLRIIKGWQISLAEATAERDKAVEIIERLEIRQKALVENYQKDVLELTSQLNESIKAKSERTGVSIQLAEKVAMGDREIGIVKGLAGSRQAFLIDKDKEIAVLKESIQKHKADLELQVAALKEANNEILKQNKGKFEKDIQTLKESATSESVKFSKEIDGLKKQIETIQESHTLELNKIRLEHKKELLKKYYETRLSTSGLTLPKQALTLLEACEMEQETDKMIEDFRNQMRESSLHSGKLNEVKIPVVDDRSPEMTTIENKVSKAFEGIK